MSEGMDEMIDDMDYDFEDGLSDCCGAQIIMGDICSECGEHCEAVVDFEE